MSPGKEIASKFCRVIDKSLHKERRLPKDNWEENSRKNILIARFRSADGEKHYNLALRSAGMGGKHPVGVGQRSAAHTEPQLQAHLVNKSFMRYIEARLGLGWEVESVFSSNQPCSSAGGGSSKGCGGMPVSSLGTPEFLFSTSEKDYVGGKGPNTRKVIKDLKAQAPGGSQLELGEGSHDSDIDESDIRGIDLTQSTLWVRKYNQFLEDEKPPKDRKRKRHE
jgi:hypothetical protein